MRKLSHTEESSYCKTYTYEQLLRDGMIFPRQNSEKRGSEQNLFALTRGG